MSFIEVLTGQIEQASKADQALPIMEVIGRIERLNEGIHKFWSSSQGWAPDDAANLMTKSRLDWQVSLSGSLRHWVADPADAIEDGDLILAWANLGSLIEGTVKLFLSVYYQDYKKDLPTLQQTKAWHKIKQKLLDPDGLQFEVLIDYCSKAELFPPDELKLFKLVQARRNAIHAYKDRPLGTASEMHSAIKSYLGMLRSTNSRLPYPDGYQEPQEH